MIQLFIEDFTVDVILVKPMYLLIAQNNYIIILVIHPVKKAVPCDYVAL